MSNLDDLIDSSPEVEKQYRAYQKKTMNACIFDARKLCNDNVAGFTSSDIARMASAMFKLRCSPMYYFEEREKKKQEIKK